MIITSLRTLDIPKEVKEVTALIVEGWTAFVTKGPMLRATWRVVCVVVELACNSVLDPFDILSDRILMSLPDAQYWQRQTRPHFSAKHMGPSNYQGQRTSIVSSHLEG